MLNNVQRGERLKELRIKNGYSQIDLAKKLGYKSDATISKWESGTNFPNGKKLVLVANLLDTTSDYLLGLDTANYLENEDKQVIELTRIADFAMMFDGKPLSEAEKDKFENLVKVYFGDKYGADR
ncbi:hypothetical protein A9Q68_08435 [Streptococcus bovimastitidis]|uniref:HTH cro/C1-type domain-containing protein n=1 Tax=Streptococcus bovimastitidis TaxID=1856638 RepID=A0A1L8MKF7_9STRE|nr:helix-turn-helix transcriptional regulator [Streptococcus bovimastitidis]OJF71218.1 hypothetical protein A9Q68_08435 [Streptococcus bovimastitidis]